MASSGQTGAAVSRTAARGAAPSGEVTASVLGGGHGRSRLASGIRPRSDGRGGCVSGRAITRAARVLITRGSRITRPPRQAAAILPRQATSIGGPKA